MMTHSAKSPDSPPPGIPSAEVLDRYLAGTASESERRAVETWLAEQPEASAGMNLFVTQALETVPANTIRNSEDALGILRGRIAVSNGPSVPRHGQKTGHSSSARWRARVWVPLSAAIAGTLGVVMFGMSARGTVESRETQPFQSAAEHRTSAGERQRVTLADGTVVTLAPESRLRVSTHFGSRDRNLWLDGEAYIQATHNPGKPLMVQTTHGVARELGTTFVVRAYADQSYVDVAVIEGRVSLHGLADSERSLLVLSDGRIGRATNEGRLSTLPGEGMDAYTSWVSGNITFTDTPLREVIPQLRRWYGADIELGDPSAGGIRLTTSFGSESLSDVLGIIARTTGMAVRQHDDQYFFVRK